MLIRGSLVIEHKTEFICEYGKKHKDLLVVVPFATLIGNSVYYVSDIRADRPKVLETFIKGLDKDQYTEELKILQKRYVTARLLVRRRQTGTIKSIISTSSTLNGPIVIKEGIRYYPITAASKKDLRLLLDSLKKNVLFETNVWFKQGSELATNSLRQFTFITAWDLLSKLTYMELKTLIAAYQLGYFNWPRIHHTEEISKYLGISRATFTEHLRKAESKIIRSILDMLREV